MTDWPAQDGTLIGCREKLRVLEENKTELESVLKDAFEDAVLMGVDADAMRRILARMVETAAKSAPMKRVPRILALRALLAPLLFASPVLAFCEAHAVEPATPVNPPSIYPPDTWEGRAAAVVRVLDRLDAKVQTLTIPVGQDGTYKSLTISAHSCLQHPPDLAPDAAAQVTVRDGHSGTKPFSDWMFAAEPFVAVFESPVYGVQLIACAGMEVAPAAPPLLPPIPPAPQAGPSDPDAPQVLQPPTTPLLPTPGN